MAVLRSETLILSQIVEAKDELILNADHFLFFRLGERIDLLLKLLFQGLDFLVVIGSKQNLLLLLVEDPFLKINARLKSDLLLEIQIVLGLQLFERNAVLQGLFERGLRKVVVDFQRNRHVSAEPNLKSNFGYLKKCIFGS